MKIFHAAATAAAVALLAAIPALAARTAICPRVSYLPLPPGAAVILNSGSTNMSGYRIVVQPDGSAQFVVATSAPVRGSVPASLTDRFFAELRAASNLATLPHSPCFKSVSFGTSLFVWWRHQRSPDLSCTTSGAGRALASDAGAIARALQVPGSASTPVLRPLPPGEFHHAAPPAPTPTP